MKIVIMFQLTFNQKVALGFIIIIFLLLASGLSSLWNLNDIDGSTSSVNETAVPVVKQSNKVEIQLLKLAKLSALAFNAPNVEQIEKFNKEFEQGAEHFEELNKELSKLVEEYPEMKDLVNVTDQNYLLYSTAVKEMFKAKLALLNAEKRTFDEAKILLNALDMVGASLVDMQFFEPPPGREKDMESVEGNSTLADMALLSIVKTVDEVKIAVTLEQLDSAQDGFQYGFDEGKRNFVTAADILKEFDTEGMVPVGYEAFKALDARINAADNIVSHKRVQLEKTEIAKQQLREADKRVSESIAALDNLLGLANEQFNTLQKEVLGSLDFGFKSSIGMLIVLILLATQNFNSMRSAIRKKMIDLANLNNIGRSLASAQQQDIALDEVLEKMHEKIGVSQGSVYLIDDNKFETKANFTADNKEAKNSSISNESIDILLEKAKEMKGVVFVPNTSKDSDLCKDKNDSPKALISIPLVDKDELIGAINLSGDIGNVHFADSDFEFVETVAQSLVTTIKNIRMREVIEEQNRNLEATVQKRTAALRQKTNDIANMMANMHQGLFTIMGGGLIHQEYAAFLEAIFETDRIAERSFEDLLFSNSLLGSDAVHQATAAVDSIVGEDEMGFDFNSHCLPTSMVVSFDNDRQKILELDWDPILNEDIVEKLMVTVRDVTALKALEAEAEEQKLELEIIGEILAVDAYKFSGFIDSATNYVTECRDIINTTENKDLDIIANLFRNMHTVKGNARTYGLKYITDFVHNAEQTYDELRKQDDMEWQPTQLIEELDSVSKVIEKYSYIFKDKLGRDSEVKKGIVFDEKPVTNWLKKIDNLNNIDLPENIKNIVKDAFDILVTTNAKPLSNVISSVVESSKSLAKELDKIEPIFDIDDGNVLINNDTHAMLNDVFMHIIRNSLDHGIESKDERIEKNKTEHGVIHINTTLSNGFVQIKLRDDGQGVSLEKIHKLAEENGVNTTGKSRLSMKEIADMIFLSGFSTAETVTNVSGRGVGMDVVKTLLNKSGGTVEIVFDEGNDETDINREFTTIIEIPESCCRVIPDLVLSA